MEDLHPRGSFEQILRFASRVITRLHASKSPEVQQIRQITFGAKLADGFEQTSPAVAGCCGIFHGIVGYDDSQYGGAGYFGSVEGGSAQYEVRAGKLHLEPGSFHSDQRVDGGPVRNATGFRIGDRALYAWIFSLRHIERYPFTGGVPHFAGLRRSHDGARRAAHFGTNVCKIRTHSSYEFCGYSRSGRPHAWADCRGLDRWIFALAVHFFREYSDRTHRFVDGLLASTRLPRENTPSRYCGAHSVRFRHRVAVLCAGDFRRT